jgi:hypothetical protein
MDIESILKALESYSNKHPREALQQAIAQQESITPHLLDALRHARENAEELPERYALHMWAALLLAQFRETRAYPLIVELLELPGEVVEEIFGDAVTEDMGRILASVCGGDTSLIERLVEWPDCYEYVRSAALSALVTLVATGQRSREEVLEYFRHLFHTAQADPDSYFWSALVSNSTDLYPDLVYDEIRGAFERNLPDPWFIPLSCVDEDLAAGKEAALAKLADSGQHTLINDTIEESRWWACFNSERPAPVGAPPRAWIPRSVSRASVSYVPAPWTPPSVPQTAQVGAKPGRNAPCPCGSGTKYKKCCLKQRVFA